MATVEQVLQLRLMIAEPDDGTYNDDMLTILIDAATSVAPLAEAAAQVWTQKAASYADLVDISEGGSSRKNGDLHKRALTMADLYSSQVDLATNGARRTRIARLTRG